MKPVLLLSFVFICTLSAASAYKYLAVFQTSARSHFIIGSALMKELARKGHEVHVVAPFDLKKPMENYYTIETPSSFDAMNVSMASFLETLNRSVLENVMNFHEMGLNVTRAVLGDPNVQKLINSNHKFDAVICEVFLGEALYGLAEHFNAPLIGLGTFGAISWNTDMVGSPSPPSYVPNALLPLTDKMTFKQRLGNLAYITFERLYYDFYYMAAQNVIYKKHFPKNKRTLDEVRRNAALVLLNSHVSLSFPRPYVPNQIEVGGMHINRKANPLPADIKKFIEESKNGVIYFSMGSNLKSKDLPMDKREAILKALSSFKQNVLWKFEDKNLIGKPKNVFISDWFPQDDILAHKNVIAFITHGGLLSTTESIFHGKPVIGIPIFGDQFLNMERAELDGYGVKVNYFELSTEKLIAAVDRVINNPSYTKKVQQMSARYRDQPLEPLQTAVFWVEHIVRHNGGKYLHCAGQDMNFIQYHSIDTMVTLYGGIILVLVLILLLVRFILCRICSLFTKKDTQNKKLKKQ